MRLLLLATLTAGLLALYWYLDQHLPGYAWASYNRQTQQWELIAQGWSLALNAWPVALIGLLGGGALTLVAVIYSLQSATDADHATEVKRLKEYAERAQKAAQSAEQDAKANLASEETRLEMLRREINQHYANSKQIRAQAQQDVLQARKAVLVAQVQSEDAERRRANAQEAANRYKRKLKRTTP